MRFFRRIKSFFVKDEPFKKYQPEEIKGFKKFSSRYITKWIEQMVEMNPLEENPLFSTQLRKFMLEYFLKDHGMWEKNNDIDPAPQANGVLEKVL